VAYEDKSDADLIVAMGNTNLTPGGDREAQILRAELDRRAGVVPRAVELG
jgi:hypothetical protein